MAETSWFLYMIETEAGRLYTGITTDLERRFEEHCTGRGAKFFRSDPPKRRVYWEAHPDRSSASRAEYRMKKLSAREKRALVLQGEAAGSAAVEYPGGR